MQSRMERIERGADPHMLSVHKHKPALCGQIFTEAVCVDSLARLLTPQRPLHRIHSF
jgi:hypothetical protein